MGSEVGEVDPVPGSYEYVLGFDVSVGDFMSSCVPKCGQELESDPFLLNRAEEWPRAIIPNQSNDQYLDSREKGDAPDTIIQITCHPLSNEVPSLVRLHKRLIIVYIRNI